MSFLCGSALGLVVRVVKTPAAGRQPRYRCVASPEFHIWGVCCCMYILPLQRLYLCNCFDLWRLPTEFKCRGIDKNRLSFSEQAHILRPLAAPSQKGLVTNYQKQRGCSR